MNIIRLKIDVNKLNKAHFFQGQSALYCDLTLLPNKNGRDQYGNDYMCVQDIGKEARERGERGPIVGNAKELERRGPSQAAPQPQPEDSDEPPF